ncbi:protamine-2 (modular protein) [Mesorhizobium sp. RP14(2022)]|uniref:Protamine-2 (Modular protein) n=1 Tax=Mesorhizobium liriopis TaxID=2953882 RepID=A0ABT1CAY1_9HYPH|nr:protamine-2 (modular protein) [Mesorhizobium liriopis]MCO6051361.1 protamine-2 (modular protein) [Mesorhizobium liriopis]
MHRRSFLAGLLGLAGVVAVAKVIGPEEAEAAVINPDGILDELSTSEPPVEDVQYRERDRIRRQEMRRKRRYDRTGRSDFRGYRGRRRRGYRTVCRTIRRNGRRRRVCRRIRW